MSYSVGDSSGKGARNVAKHIPGPNSQIEALNVRANTAAGDVSRARNLLIERGQKVSELEQKTEKMMHEADAFQSTAHQLMLKYQNKKWYQL